MRFTVAWSHVLSQNNTLRLVLVILSFGIGVLSLALVKASLREPLVIERTCESAVVLTQDAKHTKAEIDAFVKKALVERFDSKASGEGLYLSPAEFERRRKEIQELSEKSIDQRILVNTVVVEGTEATVDADRLFSVKQIRSAFRFPLKVQLSSITRTHANPYGLVVEKILPVQEEAKK